MQDVKQEIKQEKYGHYSTPLLLQAYKEGPAKIRQCLEGLTLQDLKAHPIPGKWSIAEIVIHLADADIIGACRFRQAYTSHPGDFPYYNEAEWADRMNYQGQSLDTIMLNLDLFELLRKTTGNLLDGCSESDWQKTGIHPERGKMTMRGLLELYADHSERHVAQILERIKLLGKESDVQVVLKDRLY